LRLSAVNAGVRFRGADTDPVPLAGRVVVGMAAGASSDGLVLAASDARGCVAAAPFSARVGGLSSRGCPVVSS
ncbi:MAG TPA: hypothetical protein VFV87_13395, partial [Pirellulaceae bacterium]|nr:hypothetical protein [Pirellulaceae bacterium]